MDLENNVKKCIENDVLESTDNGYGSINAYKAVIKGKNQIS